MTERNITGLYIRAKRDDRWQNLDIADLNQEELTEALAGTDRDRVLEWLAAVTSWARDNASPFSDPIIGALYEAGTKLREENRDESSICFLAAGFMEAQYRELKRFRGQS